MRVREDDLITISDSDDDNEEEEEEEERDVLPLRRRVQEMNSGSATMSHDSPLSPPPPPFSPSPPPLSPRPRHGAKVMQPGSEVKGDQPLTPSQVAGRAAIRRWDLARGPKTVTRSSPVRVATSTESSIPSVSGASGSAGGRGVASEEPEFVLMPGNDTDCFNYHDNETQFKTGSFEVVLLVDSAESTASRK